MAIASKWENKLDKLLALWEKSERDNSSENLQEIAIALGGGITARGCIQKLTKAGVYVNRDKAPGSSPDSSLRKYHIVKDVAAILGLDVSEIESFDRCSKKGLLLLAESLISLNNSCYADIDSLNIKKLIK